MSRGGGSPCLRRHRGRPSGRLDPCVLSAAMPTYKFYLGGTQMKKVLALVLALVMVFALAATATADDAKVG